MRKITAYHCDYCKYYKRNKKSVELHEQRCFYNPETRSCGSCAHHSAYECLQGIDLSEKLKTQCDKYTCFS